MTIEEAIKKYHWIEYDKKKQEINIYLDNFSLSSYRLCEAHGYLEHIALVNPRYDGTRRKPWFFDFGEFIHYCLQWFYTNYKINNKPPLVDDWLEKCKKQWLEMKMDDYGLPTAFTSDKKKYDEVGGWQGVAGLLIEYYAFYMDLRVRIVDTEITFGHNKEVHLGSYSIPLVIPHYVYKKKRKYLVENAFNIKVNCYLTGRIDLLVDNGYKVGPVDHKTTGKFDGHEHEDFNPHDGITGYILAIREILGRYKAQGLTNIPTCTGGWIYHISNSRPSTPRDKSKSPMPRFKTTPIDKTEIALQDYKDRQITTFKRITSLLFNNESPSWNTITCNNIFFRACKYKPIHEQPSNEWIQIINTHYTVGKVWDTREHGGGTNGGKALSATNNTNTAKAAD